MRQGGGGGCLCAGGNALSLRGDCLITSTYVPICHVSPWANNALKNSWPVGLTKCQLPLDWQSQLGSWPGPDGARTIGEERWRSWFH